MKLRTIRKDLVGVEPKVGDFIAYSPSYSKRLEIGLIIGFSTTGLPLAIPEKRQEEFQTKVNDGSLAPSGYQRFRWTQRPLMGFVVINKQQEENGTTEQVIQTT